MKIVKSIKLLFTNFVRDKNGRIVISQTPNIPLIAWFLFMLVAHIVGLSYLKNGFEYLSAAFLFVWAYLELTSGSSYFRRLLGLIVLLGIIWSSFK